MARSEGARSDTRMFARPTRGATARSVGDPSAAVLHRNELNEQQRPGGLVLFPQAFAPAKGEKAVPRWIPKLIRRMSVVGGERTRRASMATASW